MAPRAAGRLEALGFAHVYEYSAGVSDWGAAGLELEGEDAEQPTLATVMRRDVPTCGLTDRVGPVRERAAAAGWRTCIVVNEGNVVLGRLFRKELEGDPEALAGDVMRPGPSTYRPNVSVEQIHDHLHERGLETALVTTSEGVLLGMAFMKDIEAARS